ncbi:hypothetical protein R1flu_017637 [Riccia fluitans]|uniref:Uncharacterized protein n=1 Tax=Riccia fluitans TaxID=41844 RepID=A0ABD1ZGX8_9MARC
MPLRNILKRALLEIEAAAHRFNPVQFVTWKENRDELLKWIDSTVRSNSQLSLSVINLQELHSNKNRRQVNTQAYATDHCKDRPSWVEEACSDQGPFSAEFVYSASAASVASRALVYEMANLFWENNSFTRRQNSITDGRGSRLDSRLEWWDSFRPP